MNNRDVRLNGKQPFMIFILFIVTFYLSACGVGGVGPSGAGIEPDLEKPKIELRGNKTETIPLGANYIDPGAIAKDDKDGDLSSSITVTSDVDTSVEGTYTVTYTVVDGAGNITIDIRIVIVDAIDNIVDTSPPVITLLGANPSHILLNDTYSDAGAIANDNVDGNISANINVTDNIDSTKPGVYNVIYTVTDAAGNSATATRTVNVDVVVTDTTPPEITLLGNNPETVEINTNYVDAGATALDDEDGDLTLEIISRDNIDTSKAGTYSVRYSVTDKAGNKARATRSVKVILGDDNVKPVITLNGGNVSIEKGKKYIDKGATATDDRDGDLTSEIVTKSDVNTDAVGTYSVIYKVSDAAGNKARKIRTVKVFTVADTVKPIITIKGQNPAMVQLASSYKDAGATASDNIDGNLTAKIQKTGSVNANKLGTYKIIYTVSDAEGNTAEAVRKVEVFNDLPTSLNQAAYSSGSQYVYGFNSTNNIPIVNAPADTDKTRWAMLHDGTRYRLYFFKVGSNDTLYQFVYNGSKYEYGFGNAIKVLKITGMPSDADASNFNMLHDGTYYRLYMKSKKLPTKLYQAAFNTGTNRYEYGYKSADFNIVNAPSDADFSRMAMMHDGSKYRLYIFRKKSGNTFYQFPFDGRRYVWGGIKTLTVTGMPRNSNLSSFAMLHDGANYRFYFQTK